MIQSCKSVLAVIIALLAVTAVNAQKIPEILSLDNAIDIAVKSYPSLKAKLAEIEAGKSEAEARKVNYALPGIAWQAQALYATSNQVRGTYYPLEGTAIPTSGSIKTNGFTSDAVWSSLSSVLVNYKLANFGRKKAEKDYAEAGIQQANADYERELFEHKVKVTDAYLLSLVFEGAVKVQENTLTRTQAYYDVVMAGAQAGLRSGVDSSLAKAELSKANILLLESRKMASQQKIRLAELLGFGNGNFQLAGEKFNEALPEVPSEESPSWQSTNPILKFYQKQVDFSLAKARIISKSSMPSIMAVGAAWAKGSGINDRTDADGNFIYNSSLSGLGFRAYDYMLGFTTLWKISDIFRTKHEFKAQQFRTKSYQEQYNQNLLRLKGQQEDAGLQYRQALEIVRQTPLQLNAAQSAYNQADSRYQAGLSNIFELTQAVTVLNRAEIDQVIARNNVWRAALLKSAAKGDLSDFLNQIK